MPLGERQDVTVAEVDRQSCFLPWVYVFGFPKGLYDISAVSDL